MQTRITQGVGRQGHHSDDLAGLRYEVKSI